MIILIILLVISLGCNIYLLVHIGKLLEYRDKILHSNDNLTSLLATVMKQNTKQSRLDKVSKHCDRREQEMNVLDSFRDN